MIAVTIFCLFLSSVPTKVFSWVSTLRMAGSLPVSALFSSWVMICSWATPPPLSSSESADRTSSTSTLLVVRDSGISSPLSSLPRGFSSPVGGESETNFSPSRLVWRIVARALSGRSRLFGSLTRTLATYPSSQTFSTVPTVTSSTLTDDFGTRSRTSENSTVTVYAGPLILAPPGNGSE